MDPTTADGRAVAVHYHLFKCAGTSVARALAEAFADRWRYVEGEGNRLLTPDEVGRFIVEHPELDALSSHTATLPVPAPPGVEVLPIIFIRHPLDRARSVYEFENRQEADTPGAQMAKQTDLPGYVRWRLDRVELSDYSLANFQTVRLAPAGDGQSALEAALDALTSLPFVGVVEEFERSMLRLQSLLGRAFPDINLPAYRENVTSTEATLEGRLESLRAGLGDELYERLEAANDDDLLLWRRALAQYPRSAAPG